MEGGKYCLHEKIPFHPNYTSIDLVPHNHILLDWRELEELTPDNLLLRKGGKILKVIKKRGIS